MNTAGSGDAGDAGDATQAATSTARHAVTVLVRYFASARAAAGVETETLRLPPSASVGEAVEHLRRLHPETLPRILDAASFLLDGIAVRELDRPVPDGSELDVLPPFAGG